MRQWRKVRWITVKNYILKYRKNMENLYPGLPFEEKVKLYHMQVLG